MRERMEESVKQVIIGAYALLLSGAGKMKADKEIWFDSNTTVEFCSFPSINHIIIRGYNKSLFLFERAEYENNYLCGERIELFDDGSLCRRYYKNGMLHGRYITYTSNGKISTKSLFENDVWVQDLK